ncbi:hypothetical protein CRE_16559 [Caenorhabditis remanei]|uniref:Uncharacterized protein n=1 Tax=Caenorhabditis remanei TaxID=31234 RepID=E3NTJ5_CAERE|nr:hypothetical protein CRE_16559 [Caenorhabditis remanei]
MPPKKGGKKNKDDDWDDEAAEKKLAALNMGGASETQWDDEEPKKAKAKAKAPAKKGFAAFVSVKMMKNRWKLWKKSRKLRKFELKSVYRSFQAETWRFDWKLWFSGFKNAKNS